MERLKCVVVGDVTVGKSSLLITLEAGRFPWEYVPINADNGPVLITVDDQQVYLTGWDTQGKYDINTNSYVISVSVS